MQLNLIVIIAKFTFLESIKNRLFTLVFLGVACLFGLTAFIGELAITETINIQNALMSMVLRLFAVFIICTFVVTSVAREFNDRCFEFVLALPIDRSVYLFGKMFGFFLLSVVIVLIVCMPLLLTADIWQLLLWCISLICEVGILIAFSLFCLITCKSITSTFCVITGFYLLSRTISIIQLIGNSSIVETVSLSHKVIVFVIDMIALFLPSLERFCQTEWLVYGGGSDYVFVLVQTCIYIPLLLAAACFDLRLKNF